MKNFLEALFLVLCLEAVSFAASLIPVQVHRAAVGDILFSKAYVGTVEPIQIVQIKPELSAKISRIHFKEEAFVKAGSTLFTLDNSQYSALVASRKAEASVAAAKAALQSAQIDLAHTKITAPINGKIGKLSYTVEITSLIGHHDFDDNNINVGTGTLSQLY